MPLVMAVFMAIMMMDDDVAAADDGDDDGDGDDDDGGDDDHDRFCTGHPKGWYISVLGELGDFLADV